MYPEIVPPTIKAFHPEADSDFADLWESVPVNEVQRHLVHGFPVYLIYTGLADPGWDPTGEWFEAYEKDTFSVSTTGLPNSSSGSVGSRRFCTFSKPLAKQFTRILRKTGLFDNVPFAGEFLNVSKYFRCMEYLEGGSHYAHYDSDYVYIDKVSTCMSLVVYLDTTEEGGHLVFTKDEPKRVLSVERALAFDGDAPMSEEDIVLKVRPEMGLIVVFPHELKHGVMPNAPGETRRIIRGDLLFYQKHPEKQ